VTAFLTSLRANIRDPTYLRQLYEIGYLAHFESLLSTSGNEMFMLEDYRSGVHDCEQVSFVVSARRYVLKFQLAMDDSHQEFELDLYSQSASFASRYNFAVKVGANLRPR
jgi:hypothetical protein